MHSTMEVDVEGVASGADEAGVVVEEGSAA
jgi:hypothetical protein